MPKVSIVIPVYNCAKYIPETLSAIFSQKFQDFEVILVDDGSEDNLVSKIEPFLENKKCRYFYQENRGAAAARNLGIKKAEGEYIAFCDCDDVWTSNRLFYEVSFLEKNLHIGMCSSLGIPCNENLKPLIQTWFVDYGIVNYKLFLQNHIWTSSVVIRRSLFFEKNIFFDERFKRAQDYHLWLRLSRVTPMVVFRRIGYYYRIRPQSITRDPSKRDKNYSLLAVHDVFGYNDVDFRSFVFGNNVKNKIVLPFEKIERSLSAIKTILFSYKDLPFLSFCERDIDKYWLFLLFFCFKKYENLEFAYIKQRFAINNLDVLRSFFYYIQYKMHCKLQKYYLFFASL